MYTRPEGLSDADVAAGAERHFGIAGRSIEHRAVGFGSHHWALSDDAGPRWFVTVDDLVRLAHVRGATAHAAFARLDDALETARALHHLPFVVPPIGPTARLNERYSLAVYPYLDASSMGYKKWTSGPDRDAALELVMQLHRTPRPPMTRSDDHFIPSRGALDRALQGRARWDQGPYGEGTRDLLVEHGDRVQRLLDRHDELAAHARSQPQRHVVTHGEPHPGNIMRTADGGWKLIDWDSVLVAPPERDLWLLGADAIACYAVSTGTTIDADLLELYWLWHDLADFAQSVDTFTHPHAVDADNEAQWRGVVNFCS